MGSGTGENTFNKYEKKGGTGKGNWGSENTEANAEGKDATATKDEPEEPVEPVLTLDDYLKDNQMDLEYQVQDNSGDAKKDVVAEKGFKVMKTKEADYVEDNKKSSNVETY